MNKIKIKGKITDTEKRVVKKVIEKYLDKTLAELEDILPKK